MKKLVTVAILAVSLGTTACSGSGSGSSNDTLGCTTDVADAETTYDHGVVGIGTTTTVGDAEKALATVKSKMDDLVIVNSDATIKAKAAEASTHAGAIRVALTDGGGLAAVNLADVNGLKAAMKTVDDRCAALGAFK